ncbi:hypothetical protein PXW85_07250 [Klebsiella pneumoniae]|nr:MULTISPECIES: hypothetical protein [Gammaproteobacteria]MBX4340735.1 hypothetical protein [Mycobacterium tuberculosis]MCL8281953.1 hypothetical protein [Pseudomonas aeruginosa]MDE4767943.1 hypothetical protein [Klebsiella pneumoniae]
MRVLPRVKRRWRWLAAFIFLLWLAVLADTGATVLVTANALRLLRKKL